MIDFLKELVSTASSRVRSPVLGSIAFVFVGLNWKEFFYVFFAKVPVQVRLSYFEVNTDSWSLLYWPMAFGIGLALIYPWINLASIQLAKLPLRALKRIQGDEDHLRQMQLLENAALVERAKAEFESENEQRLIAAAERLKEAEGISPATAEELKENRQADVDRRPRTKDEYLRILPAIKGDALKVLIGLAENREGIGRWFVSQEDLSLVRKGAEASIFQFKGTSPKGIKVADHRKARLDFEDGLEKLVREGLIYVSASNPGEFVEYTITRSGYEAVDAYTAV